LETFWLVFILGGVPSVGGATESSTTYATRTGGNPQWYNGGQSQRWPTREVMPRGGLLNERHNVQARKKNMIPIASDKDLNGSNHEKEVFHNTLVF
jgi:hypothetical protein